MTLENPNSLAYQGRDFNTAQSDDQLWLRADELGLALALDPPEEAALAVYRDNWPQFSDRLTTLLPVESPDGPRLMRCFNLLGAYVLSTFVDNPEARRFRRWLLDTIVYFQIDVRREIRRLTGEDKMLRAMIEALRADQEGGFQRLREEQRAALGDLAELLGGLFGRVEQRMERLEARDAGADWLVLADAFRHLAKQVDRVSPPVYEPAGVPALALPETQCTQFRYGGETLTALVAWSWDGWESPGPWLMAGDLARLLDIPDAEVGEIPAEVRRRAGEGHHARVRFDQAVEASDLVDEAGLAAVAARWGGSDESSRVLSWLTGEVIPTLHAQMFRLHEADPERGGTMPDFARAPDRLIAEGPLRVHMCCLGGIFAHVVDARELHRYLGTARPFADWFEDRCRRHGLRRDEHYQRVFARLVPLDCYDYYLEAGVARDLLWMEHPNPKAASARDWLLEVAREHGADIKGEAERVEEGGLMPVAFHDRTLLSFKHKGEPYVAMKPLVEGLGLGWESQYNRIKRDEVLNSTIFIMNMVAADGKRREVVSLPLKVLNGWLFGIDTKRVNENIREDILRYKRECYDVLYRYWHGLEQAQRPAVPYLTDTPPHEPLSFPYRPGHGGEIRVRVGIEGGQPWFRLFDLAAAQGGEESDAHQAFAGIPECYRGLRTSLDGGASEPVVSEQGLAYYLGGRQHRTGAERLRDWLMGTVVPALRARTGAAPGPVASEPPAGPPPPEALYTLHDPLYMAFLELTERLRRAGGRKDSAVATSDARLLAWLWRNCDGGEWRGMGSKSRFAADAGIARRTLGRALAKLAEWGWVEVDPVGDVDSAKRVRPARARVGEALRRAGLTIRE